MYVIGIDPGPVVGAVRLHLSTTKALYAADALQCTPDILLSILDAISRQALTAVAIERFVVGSRAARSSTPSGGAEARRIVSLLCDWAAAEDLPVILRSAADVKPWATDERLKVAGLLEATKGMRHARDAARHALFCAVSAYGLPDPLSRKAGAR